MRFSLRCLRLYKFHFFVSYNFCLSSSSSSLYITTSLFKSYKSKTFSWIIYIMSEEFQESEVVFSDEYFKKKNKKCSYKDNNEISMSRVEKKSSPVSIPKSVIVRCTEEEEEEEEKEMIPPHVIIRKRRTETQMAFSFCTLKGRDLSRHRNSILRMTGFLET